MTKPVDIIGAEDMLTSMTNAPTATPAVQSALTAASAARVDEKLAALQQPAAPISHTLPPPGAETLGEALIDLPNDIAAWFSDFLDGFDLAGPLMGFLHIFTGGFLPWLTAAFLGLKILQVGRSLTAPGQRVRGPVNLVYYQVPVKAADPVVNYLANGQQIEVRGVQPDGQGNAMIGVPIYHSGRTNRAMAHLQTETGLEWKRL